MYDVIVVGGRCAGAATALLLARQGHKVLIVDQATFPSDVKLSTHLVWHAGVDLLQKWGVLDALHATKCPPLKAFSLDMGELILRGCPPGSQMGEALAPRRIVMDQVLLDAALAAGAQLHQGITFEDVIKDGDRVIGIRGRQQDGTTFTAHAKLVVGADGNHSRVARTVGSDDYNVSPKEAGAYNTYAYFSGVKLDGVEFFSRPERMFYAWPTHDDKVIVGIIQPGHAPRVERADVEAQFYSELDTWVPSLAARVRAGQREEAWLGAAIGTFCRQASGPGWALVGDAGLTMDPISAAGITNALRDADTLSDLVHAGLSGQSTLDEALAGYQAKRDAVSVPLLQFAQEMAKLAPPTEDVIKLFVALAGNQVQTDRYFGVFGQTVTPGEFFGPDNMAQLFTQAV